MSDDRYFSAGEVSLHRSPGDLYVSLFGRVLDLSPLFADRNADDPELFPLLAFGGKDVGHFFDDHKEVKLHVSPETHSLEAFLPFGRLAGAPDPARALKLFAARRREDQEAARALATGERRRSTLPPSSPDEDGPLPWWRDDGYVVGRLSRQPRQVRVCNTLIGKDVLLEVCGEESLRRIEERYLRFNRHALSYVWKHLGRPLDMDLCLDENGLLPSDDPVRLQLYFGDDLTEL